MKKISIIQVSYKNFETTIEPCLKSLFKCKEFPQVELVLVDNDSGKETLSKIHNLISGKDNVKLISNQANRGFPGGANDGIKHATGDVVFFLDIDTIVPDNALEKLAAFVYDNPTWIVGPVTNQTGSEQKIFTKGTDPNEIMLEGIEWTRHAKGSHILVKQLDFCCIGMKKSVLDEIGPLEEGFGLGYYEDTDFCHRAGKLGFPLMMIEEVFVYHKGGGTNLSSKKKLRQSRDFFLRKHGKEGFVSLLRQRDLNLNALKKYENQDSKLNRKDTEYRIKNRLKLADRLRPKNPLKKIRYALTIARIEKQVQEKGFQI